MSSVPPSFAPSSSSSPVLPFPFSPLGTLNPSLPGCVYSWRAWMLCSPAITGSWAGCSRCRELPLRENTWLWAFRRAETDFPRSVYGSCWDCVVSVCTGGLWARFAFYSCDMFGVVPVLHFRSLWLAARGSPGVLEIAGSKFPLELKPMLGGRSIRVSSPFPC